MYKYCPYCGNKVENQEKSAFLCQNCKKWTHYGSNPAVAIAVKTKDETLVAIRAKDPGKGEMDLVGGFLDYGEEPIDAAVREFKEEAGVEINKEELKFVGMWVDSYLYQEENQWVLNIVYLLEVEEKFNTTAADDVAELIWIPLTDKPRFAFPYLNKAWEKITK